MGKYAVSVGVNYTDNPEAALKGCVNDSYIIRSILLAKDFKDKDIRMLNDVDNGAEQPTGPNVRKALEWLCTDRTADDYIVFHFSGHGSQITSDGDDNEGDGKDEVICCAGLFLYADDDLKQHFSKLPVGCQTTVITDCCHSGGMLDHAPLNLAVGGDKADDGSVTGGGSAARTCARNLPVSTIASFLSKQLGQEVSPTRSGIAGAQANFFGGDASKLAMRFAASQMKGGGGAGGNPLATLLGGAGGGGGGGAGMAVIGGMAASALAASGKGGKSPLTAILSELGLSGVKSATAEGAPPYKPTDGPLSEDVGVLITGCESDQTSADVRPPGGKPHGALTNAIKTVYNRNPNASYTQLVLDVRAELHKSGFSQNPQLECAPNNAELPFICPGGNPTSEADEGFNGGGKFKSAGSSEAASPSGGQEAPSGAGALSKLFKACFKG